MKNFILCTLFLVGMIQLVVAQDCSAFYPFQEGVVSEITNYGKKQRVSAKVTYRVLRSDNGSATIHSEIKDKKDKVIAETEYDLLCKDDGIEIDFKSMYNPQMMQQFENMETEVTGTNIILPNQLNVGDELPDARMKMNISMSGINMNTTVTMSQRKVVAKEKVTTPAGTFECFVITHTNSVDSSMGMTLQTSSKQWIAKGVGMVKQEDYNKKGTLTSSSVLTSFK